MDDARRRVQATFLSPRDALCHVWMKLVQWLWRRRYPADVNVFSLFCYYLPMEKSHQYASTSSFLICRTRNHPRKFCQMLKRRDLLYSLHSGMLRAKFGWNLSSGSTNIYFLELTMCFHFMAVIPHGKCRGLFIWTNMNPLHPLILYALTLAKWFWRRDFFLVFWNWSRT